MCLPLKFVDYNNLKTEQKKVDKKYKYDIFPHNFQLFYVQ